MMLSSRLTIPSAASVVHRVARFVRRRLSSGPGRQDAAPGRARPGPASHDLPARLLAHLRTQSLFPKPGRALLAVSGGPDSLALLDLMVSVAPSLGLELAVAHVDHGINPDSAAVARRVAQLAHRYDLAYLERRLHLGPRTAETPARRGRYAALRAMQREAGAAYLVTAHHADDQAETVLYRLLRGSGVAGLAAIPATGPAGLVRPLLPFSRAELTQWRERWAHGAVRSFAPYRDPANVDPRHDRVWLRTQLLPLLRQRFGPVVVERLLDVASDAARERAAWHAVLELLSELEFRVEDGGVEVAQAPLARYHKTLSEALLRALAREAGCQLGLRSAARLRRFLVQGSSGRQIALGGGWHAELSFGRLRLRRTQPAATGAGAAIAGPGVAGSVRWGEWEFDWRAQPAEVVQRRSHTTWVTPGAVVVRAPQPGEQLVPLGGVGRRKVRRLLMEAKVPSRERARYPLLARDGGVVWVPGVCRANAHVPRPGEPAVRIDARYLRHD